MTSRRRAVSYGKEMTTETRVPVGSLVVVEAAPISRWRRMLDRALGRTPQVLSAARVVAVNDSNTLTVDRPLWVYPTRPFTQIVMRIEPPVVLEWEAPP